MTETLMSMRNKNEALESHRRPVRRWAWGAVFPAFNLDLLQFPFFLFVEGFQGQLEGNMTTTPTFHLAVCEEARETTLCLDLNWRELAQCLEIRPLEASLYSQMLKTANQDLMQDVGQLRIKMKYADQ